MPTPFSVQFGNNPFSYTSANLGILPQRTFSLPLSSMQTSVSEAVSKPVYLNIGANAANAASNAASSAGGGLSKLMGSASPIMAGLGMLSSIAGGISGLAAAKQMRKMVKDIPQYSRSQFPGQMLGQAQRELNFNPFQAAQARSNQARMSNRIGAAERAVTDSSQLLNLIGAYSGAAADEALNQDMANYAQRGQRLNDIYNAQMANYKEDQNVYDNSMTAFNSKANILNAANQTRTNALMSMGGNMLAGSSMMK